MLEIIPLSRPLALFEGYSATEVRRSDIDRLQDTRILGWDAAPLPLTLVKEREETCEVHTINQMLRKTEEGYFAATTRDMRVMGNYYMLAQAILSASQLASRASRSYLDDPFVSVGNLELMPARFTRVLDTFHDGELKASELEGKTIAQLVDLGECEIEQKERTAFAVSKYVRCFSMEVLRADLNGDGTQDLLVHQAFQIVGGTMSWSGTIILTRTNGNAQFERVPLSFG